jgi:hypothetical protein
VTGVYEFVQRIFPFAFPVLWVGPTLVLFFRFRKKQVAYLRRFPRIDRYRTLDMYTGYGDPPGTFRRMWDAQWHRQDDPELERFRREMWRSYGLVAAWMFGFPLLTFATIALLILTGHPLTG